MHSIGRDVGSTSTEGVGTDSVNIFVAMPFRDNLATFYEWSMKPYLHKHLGIPEEEERIRRADEFRNVGYVTCEKICRRIQEASVVVVDISTPNANVFYELGLAVGLGRTLLVFCEKNSPNYSAAEVAKALGIDHSKIISYPSVGLLTSGDAIDQLQTVILGRRQVLERAKRNTKETPQNPPTPTLRIRPLLAPGAMDLQGSEAGPYQDDIPVPFGTAITASIGVAIQGAFKQSEVKQVLDVIGCTDAMAIANQATPIDLCKEKGRDNKDRDNRDRDAKPEYLERLKEFKEVGQDVDSAFALVLDLGSENPFSYFWLGYCHARGINAIPVHRPPISVDSLPVSDHAGSDRERKQGVLAFDIRALWYIPYDKDDKPTVLAKSLESALTELLPRDLGTLQRSIFWERLTSRRKISIFTGAVHHDKLNREVVGDWDQRTVSELVRYLSQAGETVVTVLEKPVYSPETVIEKLSKASKVTKPEESDAILGDYLKLVREELSNHPDCVVVASADVNPMTEVVLAKAYNLQEEQACFRENTEPPVAHAVVALKSLGSKSPTDPNRCFSRYEERRLKPNYRGFTWGSEVYCTKYVSQDEASQLAASTQPSGDQIKHPTLLGHIAVLPNPFATGGGTIVVLNGVSGPATFGLAEMLTGGAEEPPRGQFKKKAEAERMLSDINAMWGAEKKDFFGVEGLVLVDMGTMDAASGSGGNQRVRAMFYDQRDVSGWQWYRADEPRRMNRGNPRVVNQS